MHKFNSKTNAMEGSVLHPEKQRNHYLLSVLFAAGIAVISGCTKDKSFCTPAFNVDTFEENIQDAFGNSQMGYAYVITNAGTVVRTYATGKAQSAADGDIPMSINLDMQVASISKFITSTLAIYVCREKGLSLNTTIGNYLPAAWTRGAGINNVTIAELISQTAGLNFTGTQGFNATRYDSLQLVVAAGAGLSKTRRYTNTHAGLLRIVLPAIWYSASTSAITENWCATQYKTMVQTLLFDEIAIAGDLKPVNGNQILAYTGSGDAGGGSGATSDFTLVSGGTGWNLTCSEVAKFWAYAWFSNEFIDDDDKQWVKDNRADVWNSILGGKYGDYFCKLGGWTFSGTAPNTKDMNSVVMLFPNNYQITLFTNSPVPGGSNLATLAMTAYDDAFNCN
jgi:D-alanyl-D-alanine carboxypeptidase